VDAARRLAERAGAELVHYGDSIEGRPLHAVRLPGPAGAPRVLCAANIHGVELVGAEVTLALLEAAGEPRGELARLRARAELWLIPCVNPDGYARTWAAGGAGRLAELRTNARGVDLNRNYPMPGRPRTSNWIPGAGSARHGDATYRGQAPLSEPETAALARLCAEHRFSASANLHSTMGTLIPARVTDRASFAGYVRLCSAFQAAQRRRYRRLSSRLFDVFTGEQEDFQHHAHRTWAVCVEVFPILASLRQHLRAPSLFWRFNPRDPRPWIDNDVPGIVALLHCALDLGPPPPSAVPPAALPAPR
jgi:predicted deacylase